MFDLGRRALARVKKELRDRRCATLRPKGIPRGKVLLSYVVDSFLVDRSRLSPQDSIYWHPSGWDSYQMAHPFLT
jgi:hypothetical protein